jgi:hypothetical protein
MNRLRVRHIAWTTTAVFVACHALPATAKQAQTAAATATAKQVYTPADFVRFAPKTAYDMLVQVPGFSIRSADTERGLGQASENVLINGQRITDKSGGAVDQLKRTSVSAVDRIEIVDAAGLGIAGLSGQVANVILKAQSKGSGQFSWNPGFRSHFTKPQYDNLTVSYSNKAGPVDYTVSAAALSGRGGLGGPVIISDANHNVIETRDEVFHSEYHEFVLKTKLGIDGPGSSLGNLTLNYNPYWSPQFLGDTRVLASGELRSRTNRQTRPGYNIDVNGDYDFALGLGRLKAIGLFHHEHAPNTVTQIFHYDSTGASPTGTRFARDARYNEAIARGEYRWKTGKNDWQVSLERAYNSLDQRGSLYDLDPDGEFQPVPEVRYEAVASFSRPLTSNLDLQIAAGAETSALDRVDDDESARKFFRPKGSVTLGWRPSQGWDVSLKLRRRVGQIDFLDFLAQPHLDEDRQDAGNPELVPPQSWEAETEISRDLGRWGKTNLKLHYYRVEDIIDVIPIGIDQQGIGNLPRAVKYGAESTSTFLFDPLGWKGAKLDISGGFEMSSVEDPLTHVKRPISGNYDRWANAELRQDIPGSDFAYGLTFQHNHYAKNYYLTEIYRSLDIPTAFGAYVEDKDIMGLTVKAGVFNIFSNKGSRHTLDRVVYTGFRDRSPVAFYEFHDDLVGPIFYFDVKGTF